MFRLFENALNPTEPPAQSQPPAGLVAFYWHFARQAKGLFIALFVVGLLLMVPFEKTITLALGIACLLSFIALGVYLIAHPSALLADGDEPAPPQTTPDPPA